MEWPFRSKMSGLSQVSQARTVSGFSDSRDWHGLSFLDMMLCTLAIESIFFFDDSGDFVFGLEHTTPSMLWSYVVTSWSESVDEWLSFSKSSDMSDEVRCVTFCEIQGRQSCNQQICWITPLWYPDIPHGPTDHMLHIEHYPVGLSRHSYRSNNET